MIDLHAHYLPPSVLEAAARGGLPVAYDPRTRVLDFPTGPSRPVPHRLTDIGGRVGWIDERGIDIQVLSPWMDVTGDDLGKGAAEAWCRACNDGCAEIIESHPRFRALAALPMVDGKAAADELAVSMGRPGFVGAAIPTQVAGTDLDVAGLEPLWEAAESLEALLFVHPYRVMGGERMKVHFLGNVCGNPFETTLAALRLYFSGVFTRWPRLKILLAHGGGALPYLAGRAVHASRHGPGFDRSVDHPDDILSCFYYDTLLHDPRALVFMMGSIGADRIVAGTDAPFPMIIDSPVNHIEMACRRAGLDSNECRQILRGTAEGLVGRSP